ncbi:MAG: bifunctional phosphoglucose/phosphomannose isomerase [Bacteroidia bacterium]|nr:bifunctional phosphoglucose/phosphomannose isomerase [Bacteroidia bacterium]
MWQWIRSLPNEWQAEIEAPPITIPTPPSQVYTGIVTLGMGGSAFGAEVVRAWARSLLSIPWEIIRDYSLPAWVSSRTLVISTSYSGTTEETLSATQEALKRGATVVGIASGGTLRAWGEEGRLVAFIPLPSGRPPRAAVHFSIAAQFRLLEGLGLIPYTWREEAQALLPLLFSPNHPDTATLRALSQAWAQHIIVLYAPPEYECIALRARQQIQENAKHLAWHHTIPEMNHNEIVGWEYPSPLQEKVAFWLLEGSHIHPRNRSRLDFMEALLKERGLQYARWCAPQAPYLAQLLWFLHAVDLFSIYLAEAHGVDPTPVPIIDKLKSHLAQQA